jgi:stearoyl-CoA desaturase (Delta-9 desaturase)
MIMPHARSGDDSGSTFANDRHDGGVGPGRAQELVGHEASPTCSRELGVSMIDVLPTAPSPARAVDEEPQTRRGLIIGRVITALLVIGPGVALGVAIPLLWGHAITLLDVILAVVFYAVTGHGVAIGFHRLFSHSSFKAHRVLKIVLASAGSLALEGSVIGWVANHRRHHMFSDQPGDPHSPHRYGPGVRAQIRGLAYAHVGWLFAADNTSARRFAPDLLADRDLVIVSRLFPVFAIVSLAIPFALGWILAGSVGAAVTALIWAGLVRMAVLHHVTWSVNSVCHVFGRRPFETKDQSTNFGPLAVLSFGEAWHNFHHAHPSSARHGALPHQIDSSAEIIRLFERAGWATKVRWPSPAACATASTA